MRNWLILYGNVKVSTNVSFVMAFRLVHASINNFFDRIPMGRILNRFMRDLNEIDKSLAWATNLWLYVTTLCVVDFIVATYASSPIVLIFVAFYFWTSLKIQRMYMNLYREVTRLKSICASPMIQAFSEGLTGATTIRVYNQQEHCAIQYLKTLDEF